MKKTKILIPALAVVCLSAAASVSGTVAWFSASKTVDASIKDVAIINPEGSLSVACEAISPNVTCDGSTVSLQDGHTLRDASLNVKAGTNDPEIWYATNVSSTGSSSTFAKSSSYYYNETSKISYCAGFKLTFTLAGNDPDQKTVYFDGANSSISKDLGTYEAVYSAYRVAFYNADGVNVWAPKTTAPELTHVSGESKATDKYTNVKGTASVSLGSLYASGSGQSTGTSLDVYCFIWFEGTDANCLTSKLPTGSTCKATSILKFGI